MIKQKELKAKIKAIEQSSKENKLSDMEIYENISSYIDKLRCNNEITYFTYAELDRKYRIKYHLDNLEDDMKDNYEHNIKAYIIDVQLPVLYDLGCAIQNEFIISPEKKIKIPLNDLYNCTSTIQVENKLYELKRN